MTRRIDWRLSALLSFLFLQSCGPDLHGLKLDSVKTVPASDVPRFVSLARANRPGALYLDVRFSAERDLSNYADEYGYNIFADASVCRDGQIDVSKLLRSDVWVYDGLGMIEARREIDPTNSVLPIYHLYIDTGSVPLASGPVFEYNFRRDPEDVCVKLRGGNMLGDSFTSNTFMIPKAAIAEAMHR